VLKKNATMIQIALLSFFALLFIFCLFLISRPLYAINTGIDLPDNFKPSYKFQYAQDFSYSLIPRKRINITVTKGLSKTEIELNIKHSIKEYLNHSKKPINAISVFVYRDIDEEFSAYTVARGIFAPNGKWEDADKFISYADCKLTIDYRENYFKKESDPRHNLKKGQSVIIKKGSGISISPDNWTEEESIFKLSKDTEGIIIEKKVLPVGGFDMIRYKITITSDGGEITGWVHSYNIYL